jgi:hypothetical protein
LEAAKAMTKKSITEIVGTFVDLLAPLPSEDRRRIIHAALTLLGEDAVTKVNVGQREEQQDSEGTSNLPPRAHTWMRQNGLSIDQLFQVYHLDNENVEIIASEILGKNNREKVRNAYVLQGIASLLRSGDARFDDAAARALCESHGFFDGTNHMKYMKGGNEFTGSKDKGWTLTAPGLKLGASLVAQLSKD